jgi:DIM1 family U5 snRNP protein
VVIRFGHDWDETCMQMDEVLASVADKMKNFAVIYLVDITEVPDFNAMYELYDPCAVMFFFRNKVCLRGLSCKISKEITFKVIPWL